MGNLLSIICSRGRFPSFAAAAPFLASLVLLSRGIGVYAGSPSQCGAGVVGDGRWRQTKALSRARVCARSFSRCLVGPQEVSPQYGGGGGMVVVEDPRRI
jgi:hypothetical protein